MFTDETRYNLLCFRSLGHVQIDYTKMGLVVIIAVRKKMKVVNRESTFTFIYSNDGMEISRIINNNILEVGFLSIYLGLLHTSAN